MPDDPKEDACQSSGMFSGIFYAIPKKMPEISSTEEYRSAGWLSGIFLGLSGTFFRIVRHIFWDCQAFFLGSHAYFEGIKRREKKTVTGVVSRY